MIDRRRCARGFAPRATAAMVAAVVALPVLFLLASTIFVPAPALATIVVAPAFTAIPTIAEQSETQTQTEPEFATSPIYTWLENHTTAAYVAAPLLMVTVAILPIPAEIPAAINGMLFGPILGIVVTWCGAMVGAMISYELARYFGRGLVERFVRPAVIEKFEHLKDTEAVMLLMLRLTPVVAFTVVNWASGLLQVRRSTFVWTTAVGIVPGVIAFTASGSAMAGLYGRYPGAVTAVVGLTLGALMFRMWWKYRADPSP